MLFCRLLCLHPLLVSVGGNLTCYTERRRIRKEEGGALVMFHVNGGTRGLEGNKTIARKAWVSSNIFPLRCSLYSRVITKFKLITFKCLLHVQRSC